MDKQLQNVRHDYIRYANCWEDADLLLKGLDVQNGDRVLSIGSAGDNSFSLLVRNPEIVVAVDVNTVQLYLIELKKAAFLGLEYEEFLQFLGFRKYDNRKQLFKKVKLHLNPEALDFWESRLDEIEKGIIHRGKFENYFSIFRKYVLPLIHSSSTVNQLFRSKSAEKQKIFYEEKWNNRRWNILFKFFFSKYVMGKLGRDPAFFKAVDGPVSEHILSLAAKHLSSPHCQQNYFLHYILKGNFGKELPHYARKSNFETIRENMHRLKLYRGFAEDAFREFNGFNKFNLSDIFEYMNEEQFRKVGQSIDDNAMPDSRFVYWNLLVARNFPEIIERITRDEKCEVQLADNDMGFFYSSVHINKKL